MRRAEWLVRRPWRPALLVLAVVLPLVLIGEFASADAEQRVKRDQENSLRSLAQHGADTLAGRASAVFSALTGTKPQLVEASGWVLRRDSSSPPEVIQPPDTRAVAVQLATLRGVMRADIAYLFTVDGAGIVQAGDPPEGEPAAGADIRATEYARAMANHDAKYVGADASLGAVVMAVPLSARTRGMHSLIGVLQQESIQGWLASLSGSVEDIYVIDRQGGLVGRLIGTVQPVPDAGRQEPAFAAATAGQAFVGYGRDPWTNLPALIAAAPVPEFGWSVLAVAKGDATLAEVDAALAQQRMLRLGLASALLLGALLVGGASSAAIRQRRETAEALEQQTAVGEVLKTISRSAFDLQPVLDIVLNNAVRLAGADIGWLSRVENEQFTTVAYSNEFPESVKEELVRLRQGQLTGPWIPLGTGGGLMGFTLAEGRTVHLPDVRDDPELKGSVVARLTESRTVIGVPMLRDGRTIGGMVLARYEVRPFAGREIELVQTFTDQAAIAIENVRLFNATKESLKRQTAISDVLKTISGTVLDLDPTLQTVVETAARLADADAAWMTQRAGVDSYKGGASYGRTADLQSRLFEYESTRAGTGWTMRFKAGRSIMSMAYRDERTVNVADIEADEDMLNSSATAQVVGARSTVAVPVRTENGVVGVMVLARVTMRPFSADEVELIETFADQAAIAIQNVRLFNEIQDKSQQLEIASRHKSEFLANMSHELRTPLNAIIGFSDVLLQGLFGELNEKQREYLFDVRGSGDHLLSLINDILDLSKVEAGRMDLEVSSFSFRNALDSGLTIVRERAARHSIQVSAVVASDLGTIEADERKVKQILYNLLSNAVKFTPDGGRVEVAARAANGDVQVEVRDTGIGIAPADQERIFEEFRQVGRERSREGTGLGLTLTKRFVELHGGRIWLESTPGQGSTFAFTLPLRRAAAVNA